jgi:hypothetical protein
MRPLDDIKNQLNFDPQIVINAVRDNPTRALGYAVAGGAVLVVALRTRLGRAALGLAAPLIFDNVSKQISRFLGEGAGDHNPLDDSASQPTVH